MPAGAAELPLQVPAGYVAEQVAGPPLVTHPLMGTFDHKGRLYLAASAGENLPRAELEARLPNYVQRLEDVDGDGRFDKATKFADKLTFPQGCLWWEGSLYVASSGAIWKFTDADDDGIAEQRLKLVGDFGYTGNAADVHGPFAGPDGRIYWCEGRHGHEIKDAAGNIISRGKAARIFNCRPDGSDVQTYCSGGMDNPVEVLFLPNGEMLGTVNLMYSRPRGDCLVNWQYGGVYPREDFAESLDAEFRRTGPLLPEIHNFGHVAVSGLCEWPAANGTRTHSLMVTQFNTNRVVRADLGRTSSGDLSVKIEDFVISDDRDFHPTDVLVDADGSLLVIDTGGWFRIGCPKSEVAKSDLLGAIYRIRNTSAPRITHSRGEDLDWNTVGPRGLLDRLEDSRPEVRRQAVESLAMQLRQPENLKQCEEFSSSIESKSADARQCWIATLARVDRPAARQCLARFCRDAVPEVRQLAIRSLLYAPPEEFVGNEELFRTLISTIETGSALEGRLALATAGRLFASRPGFAAILLHADESVRLAAAQAISELRRVRPNASDLVWVEIPAAGLGQKLSEQDHQRLVEIGAALAPGNAERGRQVFRSERIGCTKCHRVAGEGGLVGPDLSTIGRSRAPADLLESILYPSATFARGFAPYAVVTKDGRIFTGIVLAESSTHLRLGLDKEKSATIPNGDIDEIRAAEISIMPADVAKTLTSDELADLTAYLQSLR
jgi:putative heme-binding domain-containing protein